MAVQTKHNTRRIVSTFAVTFALVFAGGFSTVGAQGDADDPAQVEAGMAVFESNCAGCHGADGTGSNTGRPLTGIADQEADRSVHIASVTDGKGGMPAFGGGLTAEEIDSAVSYVRLTFVAQDDAELAVTGVDSADLAFIGLLAAGAGIAMVTYARRRELA